MVHEPGPGARFSCDDVPVPAPGPGQVLIEARYAAVNFADVKRRRGEFAPGMPHTRFVPGIEVSGRVVELGPGAEGLAAGTPVVALLDAGGYAQYVVADAAATFPVPPALPERQAGALGVVANTAYLALATFGRARPGESVVVTSAAGGVGSVATQIAALLGLTTVVAAAGTGERAHGGLGRGATHSVVYGPDLADRLREATGGRGVDLVLDARGGEVRQACVSALAPGGRLVHFGNSSGQAESMPAPVVQRESLIATVGFSLRRCRVLRPALLAAAAAAILAWAAEGRLTVPIDRVLPLCQAGHAHRLLESQQVVGKLLLESGEPS